MRWNARSNLIQGRALLSSTSLKILSSYCHGERSHRFSRKHFRSWSGLVWHALYSVVQQKHLPTKLIRSHARDHHAASTLSVLLSSVSGARRKVCLYFLLRFGATSQNPVLYVFSYELWYHLWDPSAHIYVKDRRSEPRRSSGRICNCIMNGPPEFWEERGR